MNQQQQFEMLDGLVRAMDEHISEYNQLGTVEDIREKLARLAAYESLGTPQHLKAVMESSVKAAQKIATMTSELQDQREQLAVVESALESDQSIPQLVTKYKAFVQHARISGYCDKHGLPEDVVAQVVESVAPEKVDETLGVFKAQLVKREKVNESVHKYSLKYNLPPSQVSQILESTDQAKVEAVLFEAARARQVEKELAVKNTQPVTESQHSTNESSEPRASAPKSLFARVEKI